MKKPHGGKTPLGEKYRFWEKIPLANVSYISNIQYMARARLDVFERRLVELAGFARALSHPARIRILRLLAGKREVGCMELVAALPLSQPTCSRHINKLVKAGLLKARARGRHVYFRLDESALRRFCQAMNRTLHADEV